MLCLPILSFTRSKRCLCIESLFSCFSERENDEREHATWEEHGQRVQSMVYIEIIRSEEMRYDTIWFNTALDYANVQHGDNAKDRTGIFSK